MSQPATTPRSSLPSTAAFSPDMERIFDRFEDAWQSGARPKIADFLGEAGNAELLIELVHIDLECRLKAGEPALVEDYLRQFGQLPRHTEVLVPLLVAEYQLRKRYDPQLDIDEYRQRFPELFAEFHERAIEKQSRKQTTANAAGQLQPATEDDPLQLGRYRIEGRLGAGGFGVVYRAYDEQLHRHVAIKVPRTRRWSTAEERDAYLLEAQMLASLDHPGIVPIYDVGHLDDGRCYLVSQLIAGRDLTVRLREGAVPVAEAVSIVTQVAEALHHAHERGLVHRDIKPANILLQSRAGDLGPPAAFVVDFGLALREEDFGRGAGYAGTPAYMSPEQARGEGHRVDARTDVYSLGVVFYKLLTGVRPFRGEILPDVLDEIKTIEPRPPRQLNSRIPRELDRICLKALSKRAAERYSTALDFAEDLRHWQPRMDTAPASDAAPPVSAMLPAPTTTIAGSTDSDHVKVVPKGLRAFDETDAGFFLDLLPGARDRDGLPDSIRFWKNLIETTDADRTFRVGLLYGPTGCGKTSLVKAGLLPRLSRDVRPLYVEATAEETELRLLRGIRKNCPDLPLGLDLIESMKFSRRGGGRMRHKVVILIDQFEQWLHAQAMDDGSTLIDALRQCDGQHVQCVVMVRDDFWMAATRFMRSLEIPLIEGGNSAAVDLFDPRHARKILTAFGRAFGCLPDDAPAPEQNRFLEQSVAELTQDGKIVPVRLALFTEMVKGKPWTPATIKDVGGVEGIGVTFLEETFSAAAAPPTHRLHAKAARAVLKALLPEQGAMIKGHRLSREQLLGVSGYAKEPRDFEELLRILDIELRLITPAEEKDEGGRMEDETAQAHASPSDSSFILHPSSFRFYQLTHDYLVPAIHQWLNRKQRETRRGRAEMLLAERAAAWNARPEWRQLPTAWEGVRMLTLTRRRDWTPAERRMLSGSNLCRIFKPLISAGAMVMLGVVALWALVNWAVSRRVSDQVAALATVATTDVPWVVFELDSLRPWANPLLRQLLDQSPVDSKPRLHASLALLPFDPEQVEYLYDRMLHARPDELLVIRDALYSNYEKLTPRLWQTLDDPRQDLELRFRAACVLALYDGRDALRWQPVRQMVVDHLVQEKPLTLGLWVDLLRPARRVLLAPLEEAAGDPKRSEMQRAFAANIAKSYRNSESTGVGQQ